jgi:hypothetical protein
MLTEQEVVYFVQNPVALLLESTKPNSRLTEKDWKQLYHYLLTHRMTPKLCALWAAAQQNNGNYKFKAVGQLFARYATIGKGWQTVRESIIEREK